MKTSAVSHLTKENIIKNGSIFTPEYIVLKVKEIISPYIDENTTIIDFGAGYGAFIKEFCKLTFKNIIATEVDDFSYKYLKNTFTNVDVRYENSLQNISRGKYSDSKIVVIGNPPYNDITSQYKKGQKGHEEMDEKVYARDLGISFLKMYSVIESDYICVLHPLSYLIKKSNFNSLRFFKDNYKLERGIIFSSKLFETINKSNIEFPVIIAFYKKCNSGMNYEYIKDFNFEILNSKSTFKLNNFKTIDGIIEKYPTKNKTDIDLQFYTIRDINALKRNKTFLTGFCSNGIKVDSDNIYLYSWLDFFKQYFKPNDYYLYGNLSPLMPKEYDPNKFIKELLIYIVNNNEIVRDYVIKHNWDIKDYIGHQYDFNYLISLLNSCI